MGILKKVARGFTKTIDRITPDSMKPKDLLKAAGHLMASPYSLSAEVAARSVNDGFIKPISHGISDVAKGFGGMAKAQAAVIDAAKTQVQEGNAIVIKERPVLNTALSGGGTETNPSLPDVPFGVDADGKKLKGRAATLLSGKKGLLGKANTSSRTLLGA